MTDNDFYEDEVLEDVEPFEGDPEYDEPQSIEDVADMPIQDDESGDLQQRQVDALDRGMPHDLVGFMGKMNGGISTWRETLEWFKSHRTKDLIGFDPDGMCLKIQRTARNIPARYLTARDAMLATPHEFRHTKIADLRRGMVAYYADPHDSNPADHIVGVLGRVKDFDPHDLNDVLMITNSVQADRLTIVRGTYFEQHWGDDFKFGATWLNGYELDVPFKHAHGEPVGEDHGELAYDGLPRETKVKKFHDSAPEYDLRLLDRADRPKAKRILDQIETQVRRLPNAPGLTRVKEFKLQVKDDRILDLRILDEAVNAGRVGLVKSVRDEIRRLIGALPDE